LFEIIYPDNRIVLNYGERDELIPLGGIYIPNGTYVPADETALADHLTLRDVLELPVRENAEGWVIWLDDVTALKLKQQDYVELHRIVTGLNRKSIWRKVSNDSPDDLDVFYAALPDELQTWAQGVARELQEEYAALVREIDNCYLNLLDYIYDTEEDWVGPVSRKEIADWVNKMVPPVLRGYVFATLDNKDIQDKLWASIEPVGSGK
jgi:RNA ligase